MKEILKILGSCVCILLITHSLKRYDNSRRCLIFLYCKEQLQAIMIDILIMMNILYGFFL
jgi:hypothetical protein